MKGSFYALTQPPDLYYAAETVCCIAFHRLQPEKEYKLEQELNYYRQNAGHRGILNYYTGTGRTARLYPVFQVH